MKPTDRVMKRNTFWLVAVATLVSHVAFTVAASRYASGMYTPATLTHKPPQGNDARCGSACHTIAKAKDYVFTEYAKR